MGERPLVPLPGAGLMGLGGGLMRAVPIARSKPSPKPRGDAPRPPQARSAAPSPVVYVPPPPAPRTPAPPRPLSTRERVALAVLDLHEGDPPPWPRPAAPGPVPWVAVVLACWERWPLLFGLRGHELDHPDSNRVLARLSGCAAEGYVTSDGRGGWTPTRAALALHAALRAREAVR